jgi:hypothetical protein
MRLPTRDLAAVLAGLRLLQRTLEGRPARLDDVLDILTDGGRFPAPTAAAIDALAERLNLGD